MDEQVLRARRRERDSRIAAAAERGVSREEFEVREADAAEDARCAHELEVARYEVRQGPPEYVGTVKVSDAEKEAFWAERIARQEKALQRFRSESVEGPDSHPIDPERHRDFVAGSWRQGDPPFPPGDLGRRDELVYTRREPSERHRPASSDGADSKTRPELAGETVPVKEQLSERFPDGVRYDDAGRPDLSRYASKTVRLDNGYDDPGSAERPGADARANELFGWTSTPEGMSWHKAGDGRTVLLVDSELHDEFGPDDRTEGGASEQQGPPGDAAENSVESRADAQYSHGATDRQDAAESDDMIDGVDAAAALVVRGDAALAGLSFDPSKRAEELGDCFRPGAYDVHRVLDQMPRVEAGDLVRTVQRAADLGARVDMREEHPVLAVRWDARDAATFTDCESLEAFLDRGPASETASGSELSAPMSRADTSAGVLAGFEENLWMDPEKRRSWVEERLADPTHTKAVTSDLEWARYQRARVGDVEVELETAEPGSTIWADGLEIDPDAVVVVEVKYVMRPDRSLYEGKVPERMLDVLLYPFDDEMERYASVVQHNANPVERIRLVTSTDAAARFLGERARKILGEDIDLDVQVWQEEER
ncbi:restriction endonuclease fold toxin-2 domain-containing protein [Kribbella sp. NPDC055110]